MPAFAVARRTRSSVHPVGLTLVELLICLALLAILGALAAPSFAEVARQYRVATVRDALLVSMALARSEAIRRGEPVNLVPLPQAHCGKPLQGRFDWSCGWRVVDSQQALIQEVPITSAVALHKSRNQSGFSYGRFGQVVGGHSLLIFPADRSESVATSSHWLLCFSTGARVRTLKMSLPPCP
jgi:prepilin-type N-terminal cleavage/methylation domain-containing protein